MMFRKRSLFTQFAATVLLATCCAIKHASSEKVAGSDITLGPICKCTKEYVPVCSNGTTFGNKCLAACVLGANGTWTDGECKKPCICPEIYKPVCGSDGKTYSNACFASCELGPNGNWTDGECKKPCICFEIYKPVCGSNGKTYSNACFASCELGPNGNWTDGECKKPCICPLFYKPVCGSDGKTYSNACFASCELGPNGNWTDGECKKPCICPLFYKPVCGSDGKTYSNACFASCELGPNGNWTDGECKKPCICPLFYKPVCGSDGKTYSNACFASCELGPNGNWTDGECKKPCICPLYYKPVCGSDGKTYSNECEARCALGDKGKWIDGSCEDLNPFAGCLGNVRCARNTCDDGCPSAPPGSVCFQNTCSGQTLYGKPVDPCAAVWVDPATKRAFVCPLATIQPNVSCDLTVIVDCLAGLCDKPCPSYPNAVCTTTFCLNGTVNGYPVPPCQPVYVGADGLPRRCPDDDISSCAPNSPRFLCTTQASHACDNATCPSHPNAKCIVKPCRSVFHGVDLPACSPIWFDPDTVELIDSCDPTPSNTIDCGSKDIAECFADPCSVNSCPADPDAKCIPSYCSSGTFQGKPVGPCEAVYVDANGNRVDCGPTSATTKLPSIKCLTSDTVACFADPCQVSSCPADPTATCLASYCSSGTFQGKPVGPCEAVYVNMLGSRVNCGTSSSSSSDSFVGASAVRPTIKCNSNQTVACFADPCSVNTCPAHPDATCLASYCANGTFQGKPVGPCEAVYVDANGNRVNCTIPDDIFSCSPNSPRFFCISPSPCANATCPAHPGAKCISKPCSSTFKGVQLPACSAIWYDPKTNDLVNDCFPPIKCNSNRTVACFADPCSVNTCPAHPDATCLASYCANGTFQGKPVGPCEAVYVDANGNRVNCTTPETGVLTCAPGSANYLCTREAFHACDNATCPANPNAKCTVKFCTTLYRGVELPACTPIWYDPATGVIVEQCYKKAGCSCPYTYNPVCASYKGALRTFPNSCAAQCAGATIVRTGKCSRCNTTECAIGALNDLCFLGAPTATQCLASKYECRGGVAAAVGAPADSFLGKCLAKSRKAAKPHGNGGGGHRRHSRHMLTTDGQV